MSGTDKTAFCFPGVGVKHCGAELRFYQEHEQTMAPLIETMGRASNKDILVPFTESKMDSLNDRQLQFFTYGFSCGVAQVCKNHGITPHYTSGYSFGVYAALWAAGSIDFETGIEILSKAYQIMDSSLPSTPCGMGVTVGLSTDDVNQILSDGNFPSVNLTGTNSDTCLVFSGETKPLDDFLRCALEQEAIAADRLPVEIPYHHSDLLHSVVSKFRGFLKDVHVEDASCPVVSTIDQKLLTGADSLNEFITMNLCTPINWRQVIATIHRLGVRASIECGPGISLTQNGRFIPFENMKYLNVKNLRRKLDI